MARSEHIKNPATDNQPTILYVDCSLHSGIDRRRLNGLRRYADARKWRVETLEHKDCTSAALRDALERLNPIGCAAECWCPETAPRPPLFGRTPVVYFEPPDGPRWRGAHGITCDNSAVGRMAFEELSSTRPPAYAVVSCVRNRRWARERIDAFLECCRKAEAECDVAHFPFEHADEFDECVRRMVPWVASLPHRCAVFAVNDLCAIAAAEAMAAAGRSFPRSLTLVGADGDDPPPWDRETAETVSSVRLDHELAGYLAAKALSAFAANDGLRSAQAAPSLVFPPILVERRKSTRGYGRREPRILEAVEMIRREACDGLTAANLAGRFRGTRQLFDLRFREAMGHSPLDEIIHVRLERVLELLAQPDFPISAIADFSGFSSERVLQKHFRTRFHTSMRDWRKARQ
jgi:LacI family transcriptional regulator